MRVAFNARLLASHTLRGWNRYTVNVLRELAAIGIKPVLFSQSPVHKDHLNFWDGADIEIHLAPRMKTLQFDQFWLPSACSIHHIDLLHSTFNFGLPSRMTKKCPQVLTLHDAIDYVYYRDLLPWYRKMGWKDFIVDWQYRTSINAADAIITVSQHAKADISSRFGLDLKKLCVTYEAADECFHAPVLQSTRQQLRSKYSLAKPFFFYLGGWERRKNIPFLLDSFAEAKLDGVELVLGGGLETQRQEVLERSEKLRIRDRVRLLNWVDDIDLPVLYSEALAFVLPSEYEGFGLQLCEAMATGCPVLAARATCLPEILGEGGQTFSLTNTNELVGLLKQIVDYPEFRRKAVQFARHRSPFFSWSKCAQETKDVYSRLLSQSQSN